MYNRRTMPWTVLVAFLAMIRPAWSAPGEKDYPYSPVPFTEVRVHDGFWAPRMEINRTVSIPAAFDQCEKTGRIDNFKIAGGLVQGKHRGLFGFDDSDTYKIAEGASYALMLKYDARLEAYLDKLISYFAAAQEHDGYLYTTLTNKALAIVTGAKPRKDRWDNLAQSHELYCAGHMYEAAAAHFQATGKRSFLDVAVKNADLLCAVFGPGKLRAPDGHPEVELGLVKLYRATGKRKYLELAKFLIDIRGRALDGRKLWGDYCQDHKPILEQDEAVGHAVRAAYLYAGVADVAALTGDADYVHAIDTLWNNAVAKKLYLTGGIGARHAQERFGNNYELPNRTAYNETCASIANVYWNHRLFGLHGDAKYIDVLERTLYNGVISGVSLDGTTFFYPNPLESDGKWEFNKGSATRQPWFGCACCPANITRFLASVPGYAYAHRGEELYLNLFMAGQAEVRMADRKVAITQETRYPWDGTVKLTVAPEAPGKTLVLKVRIPGWARNEPVPSDLYRFLDPSDEQVTLKVNGRPVEFRLDKGYAVIERPWQPGDTVELKLPMPIRRIVAHEAVEADRGRVAIQRGPIVYCAEGVDNGGKALEQCLPDNAPLRAEYRGDLLGGVTVITAKVDRVPAKKAGGLNESSQELVMVPYCVWANRGAGEMVVWLHRRADGN